MLKSSLKFNDAFEDNVRKIYARVTINNDSYDEDDIYTIDLESGSVNGPGYQIGTVYSDLVKIKFDKVIRGIKELDKVIVELGIERESVETTKLPSYNSKIGHMRIGGGKLNKIFYDNPIEYSRLGVFYVSEHADINENDKTTTITCMDAILYFEQQYKPTITFPADIFNVATDIARQASIQLNVESFLQLPEKKINKPEEMTLRTLIGYLSQFACGFVKVSKFGVLDLKTPRTTERIIDSSSYHQKGLSKNDLKYRIDGILCKNQQSSSELISGATTGSQLSIENPFIEQKDLDNIFELVKGVEYYPFTMQWYGIPSIEAGDWLIVKDNEGNQFRVPNLSYKLNYNGGLKATSSAETFSQSSELKIFENPLNREISRLNKEVASVKDKVITNENIIEKINISEEVIDGKSLRILGRKISVDDQTEIKAETIKSNHIESLSAEKITGKSDGAMLDIDFDNELITSYKNTNSKIRLNEGKLSLENNADILINIDKNIVEYTKNLEPDKILEEVKLTEVVEYSIENTTRLGLIYNSETKISELFLNEEGDIMQNQVIMALLISVKKLNEEIEFLKSRGV